MTEKEIIKHAKDYIDSLANGTNPLTGEPVNESDVVNNVRISRCLFYVSEILEKVLNGERNILPRVKKSKFYSGPQFPTTTQKIIVKNGI